MIGVCGRLSGAFAGFVALLVGSTAQAGDEAAAWKPHEAGRYLDAREDVWFGSAQCVSCHTVLPYALARPALRKLVGAAAPPAEETKLFAQIRRRVANWEKLDSREFGLYYDSSDEQKAQSWGTEAVFNAAILAFDDRFQGRSAPTAATRQAFAHLWQTQVREGENKGSWDWLDFNEPPWGTREARYFGAALAAIAVGTAPGYRVSGSDAESDAGLERLKDYLKTKFAKQNLHDRAWALWAAASGDGILTRAEQKALVAELLSKQQADDGWSLISLGPWSRKTVIADGTISDGYATSLVLHVLQTAGVMKAEPRIARGLAWLTSRQAATGAWRSTSLIKKRDPASHTGKFMSDAATAFAVLALGH